MGSPPPPQYEFRSDGTVITISELLDTCTHLYLLSHTQDLVENCHALVENYHALQTDHQADFVTLATNSKCQNIVWMQFETFRKKSHFQIKPNDWKNFSDNRAIEGGLISNSLLSFKPRINGRNYFFSVLP